MKRNFYYKPRTSALPGGSIQPIISINNNRKRFLNRCLLVSVPEPELHELLRILFVAEDLVEVDVFHLALQRCFITLQLLAKHSE